MKARTHVEALPGTIEETMRYVKEAILLPHVQRVTITPKDIEVVRVMADDNSPVMPRGSNSIDMQFLLTHIELISMPFAPNEHPTWQLHDAYDKLNKLGLEVCRVVCPSWTLTSAWLQAPAGLQPVTHLLGQQVMFVPSSYTNNRIVVLGMPKTGMFVSDATTGVVIDMGA